MANARLHAVTGAFGYSGRHIAQKLLARGLAVRTLTNSAAPLDPLGRQIDVHPLNFADPQNLIDALRNVDVLYNTYWVRFNYGRFTHAQAVENTRLLFDAARRAGVGRIVHVSITNPSLDSELEYFRGKAQLEHTLKSLGIAHSILRPAVLFGGRDILINNIAWAIRHLPVYGVFGDGQYRLQPIHVQDFADLAVEAGQSQRDSETIDAIGPETFTYRRLAETLAQIIGRRVPVISVPPSVGYGVGWLVGSIMGDVTITREEIRGLMDDLLYVPDAVPRGTTPLTAWARAHRTTLGRHYASELARRRSA